MLQAFAFVWGHRLLSNNTALEKQGIKLTFKHDLNYSYLAPHMDQLEFFIVQISRGFVLNSNMGLIFKFHSRCERDFSNCSNKVHWFISLIYSFTNSGSISYHGISAVITRMTEIGSISFLFSFVSSIPYNGNMRQRNKLST